MWHNKNLAITNGPYNEPGGAYMFYGTASSHIEFPNNRGLDTRFSITLMCWVGGQDGPLVSYGDWGVMVVIEHGKFLNQMIVNVFKLVTTRPTEVLPAGKSVHVVASYDYSSGNNSVYYIS